MLRFQLIAVLFPVCLCIGGPSANTQRTIAAFESSTFYKSMGKAKRDSWSLKTGGMNNSYSFKDPDTQDPLPSLSVAFTTVGPQAKEISISWLPYDSKVKMTPKKEGQIKLLLQFWGTPELADQVISFARDNYKKNYPNSVGASPKTRIGSLSVQCGQTAGDVYLSWSGPSLVADSASVPGISKKASSSTQPEGSSLKLKRGTIRIGMTSDEFVKVVRPNEVVSQKVEQDLDHPGSMRVTKSCSVDGKDFLVVLARVMDPGPYLVVGIKK